MAASSLSLFTWSSLHACQDSTITFLKIIIILFIYFGLCWVFVAELRFLIAVTFVVEHGLWSILASVVAARGLRSCSSRAVEHRINSCGTGLWCSMVCRIFPDQGSNPRLLHWQADSLPLSHQGSCCHLSFHKDYCFILCGLFYFALKYSLFTILCYLQVYSKVIQLYINVYPFF